MKRVFSVCLWGDNDKYNIGAIKNADLCKLYYPDFEYWIYIHEETVPLSTIEALKKRHYVKIILKNQKLYECNPMSWRFEAIDVPDVELIISRDVDTIILEREVVATNEWLKSGMLFHIMRDHPHHRRWHVFAGMFGTRKIPEIPSWTDLIARRDFRCQTADQDLLEKYIYPIIYDKSLIHDNFWRPEENCQYFTTKYNSECDFVGMYVYPDGSRSKTHMEIIQEEVKQLKEKGIHL